MKRLFTPSNELEKLICRLFLAFSALLAGISLVIALFYALHQQRAYMDRMIAGSSTWMAELPQTRQMIRNGYPESSTTEMLDLFVASIPDVTGAVIYNTNGVRFYNTSRDADGETYLDGDEIPILHGAAPYITTGYGTLGAQRRSFHAVTDESGKQIGFVMLAVSQARISAANRDIVYLHLFFFVIMIVFCLIMTAIVIRRIRHTLRGNDPDELIRSYTNQDAALNSLAEGLLSVDASGTVTFSNREAGAMLSADGEELRNRSIFDLFPDSSFARIVRGGQPVLHKPAQISGRRLLISEVPMEYHGIANRSKGGMLVILQDQTETLRLSDELSGARSMMDTMRAFNHEYLNKLHIILGYLQTGDIDSAKQFIINSNLVTSQAIRETANNLRISRLCALVVGKMMHAAELGITLKLVPGSSAAENNLLIPESDLCTIVGNLLENAIDELKKYDFPVREINLGIFFEHDCNIISCEDTGSGIDPKIRERMFEQGVTTKGIGHGTGLHLVHDIAANHRGTIEVESEQGEGTCFTVTFARQNNE